MDELAQQTLMDTNPQLFPTIDNPSMASKIKAINFKPEFILSMDNPDNTLILLAFSRIQRYKFAGINQIFEKELFEKIGPKSVDFQKQLMEIDPSLGFEIKNPQIPLLVPLLQEKHIAYEYILKLRDLGYEVTPDMGPYYVLTQDNPKEEDLINATSEVLNNYQDCVNGLLYSELNEQLLSKTIQSILESKHSKHQLSEIVEKITGDLIENRVINYVYEAYPYLYISDALKLKNGKDATTYKPYEVWDMVSEMSSDFVIKELTNLTLLALSLNPKHSISKLISDFYEPFIKEIIEYAKKQQEIKIKNATPHIDIKNVVDNNKKQTTSFFKKLISKIK